jgi:Uri superfamily endonuclease
MSVRNNSPVSLAAGRYFYCGSAKGPGGLQARIARHMRHGKAIRWHIDNLTEAGHVLGAWTSVGGHECEFVAALAHLPTPVRGFGIARQKLHSLPRSRGSASLRLHLLRMRPPLFNISFPARCRALVRRQFRRTTESRFVAVVFIIRSCRRTRRPWFRVTTGNTIPKTRLLPEAACANESRADVGPPCFSFRAASRVDVRDLFQVSVDVLGKNADAVPYELIVNVRRERRICARQKARGRTLRSTPLCDLPAGATEASKSLTVVCAPRERRPS